MDIVDVKSWPDLGTCIKCESTEYGHPTGIVQAFYTKIIQ